MVKHHKDFHSAGSSTKAYTNFIFTKNSVLALFFHLFTKSINKWIYKNFKD